MTVGAGQMRLYDMVVPGLDSGPYAVETRVDGLPDGQPLIGSQAIEVIGPRFVVPAELLADVEPDRDAIGAFEDRLPHVALTRRTLPWERTIAAPTVPAFSGPFGDLGSTPWTALVVARQSEAELVSGVSLTDGIGAAARAGMAAIDPIPGPDPTVTVLRGRGGFDLRSVIPTPAEVRLLAHVRQVNVADTTMNMGDDDGWFAVVTANRLPEPDGGDTPYLACLVSLEGRADVYTPGAPLPSLLVLASWPFIASAGGTFAELARDVAIGRLHDPADAPFLEPGGRLRLQRTVRAGTTDDVLYAGPLAPTTASPPHTPDADGAPDVSLEVAEELGRLLAMSDGALLRRVVAWRRATDAAAHDAAADLVLDEAMRAAGGSPALRRAVAAAAPDARPAPPRAAAVGVALLGRLARAATRPADMTGVAPQTRRRLAEEQPRLARAVAADELSDDALLERLSDLRDAEQHLATAHGTPDGASA